MLKNFTRIAIRNLWKDRYYTLLNILGLGVGLACFAYIMLWTRQERSYDQFHTKAEQIYRLAGKVTTDAEMFEQAVTAPPFGPTLKKEIPEIVEAARLDVNDAMVIVQDQRFMEDDIVMTDPSFFSLFDFDLLQGDIRTCLTTPYSIVLTEALAQKYFGDQDPIGQSITMLLYDPDGNGAPYTVTGVVADPPLNSHFTFTMLGSFSTVETAAPDFAGSWFENGIYTYVQLTSAADHAAAEAKLIDFVDRHLGPTLRQYSISFDFQLQPLLDIYFHSNLRYEIGPVGDLQYVWLFSLIGWLVLIMAAINYVNLATARSLRRVQEISVRKVLGAERRQLIAQILTEAVLVTLIALGVSVFFIELLKPIYQHLSGNPLTNLYQSAVIWQLPLVAIGLGLLSGIYPAFFISSYTPKEVLTGHSRRSRQGNLVRKGLIVFQFTVCAGMIIGLAVIQHQMFFVQSKNLGFNKEAVLTLSVNGNNQVIENYPAFAQALKSQPAVRGMGVSNTLPVGGLSNSGAETISGKGEKVISSTYRMRVDPAFFEVYDLELAAGRLFHEGNAQDSSNNFILNESAVRIFGWNDAEAAIGKPFRQNDREGAVIGIVKDFHFNSLRHPIDPVAISFIGQRFSRINIRLAPEQLTQSVEFIKNSWQQHFPDALLDYSFLDEQVDNQYQAEQKLNRLFSGFFSLALFIAIFGLLGLSAYAAELRTKEIGVRKVLGASARDIIQLLSKDFIILVIIAIGIATPVGWYLMDRWLTNFVYHVQVAWWIFPLTGVLLISLALLTVGLQSLRTALTNPVDALRYE